MAGPNDFKFPPGAWGVPKPPVPYPRAQPQQAQQHIPLPPQPGSPVYVPGPPQAAQGSAPPEDNWGRGIEGPSNFNMMDAERLAARKAEIRAQIADLQQVLKNLDQAEKHFQRTGSKPAK